VFVRNHKAGNWLGFASIVLAVIPLSFILVPKTTCPPTLARFTLLTRRCPRVSLALDEVEMEVFTGLRVYLS
jgi:hypothetical protein